jgi:hypothetical protein
VVKRKWWKTDAGKGGHLLCVGGIGRIGRYLKTEQEYIIFCIGIDV